MAHRKAFERLKSGIPYPPSEAVLNHFPAKSKLPNSTNNKVSGGNALRPKQTDKKNKKTPRTSIYRDTASSRRFRLRPW